MLAGALYDRAPPSWWRSTPGPACLLDASRAVTSQSFPSCSGRWVRTSRSSRPSSATTASTRSSARGCSSTRTVSSSTAPESRSATTSRSVPESTCTRPPPLDPEARRSGLEGAAPVTIGPDVWLGGGTIVCPGVSIGAETTIAAGSVVVRDVLLARRGRQPLPGDQIDRCRSTVSVGACDVAIGAGGSCYSTSTQAVPLHRRRAVQDCPSQYT